MAILFVSIWRVKLCNITILNREGLCIDTTDCSFYNHFNFIRKYYNIKLTVFYLMSTTTQTRRAKIIEILDQERYLKIAGLSQRFGISQMSIRRDLCQLEEQGLLRRVHGGLVATPLLRLGLEIHPQFAAQIRDGYLEKEAIARMAASLVQPGDHVIFDSGALAYLIACSLPGDLLFQGELTVITNSLPVALELAPWPGVETILLGGEYPAGRGMDLVGPSALRSLEGLHAEKIFLSVDAIGVSYDTTFSNDETELRRRMIAACAKVIVLVSAGKVGQVEQMEILHVSTRCVLVTGKEAPADFVSNLRSQGVEVLLA